ncbi:bifunctional adenosylcobinamide kinase/adenosylcobinamide-phosphate guanylyltransferase [Brachymonas denitrificans]|uniref:bifunctional adenosylcobinamide kinase/adenosylcobinamide-phosphate guanylyltransferase n=1 Tax=Brachymonas denitrificans TaxID=28220 RepID=UPI002AFE0AB4|nr:bifunctional adenosylcobinamide kinase/adenosylcobinamide-phosphate guanylyltransferase [Brachymonas denitrificans]
MSAGRHHELILGGQKSGKTVRAERAVAHWLEQDPARRALYLATALPWDAEMQERIARHQQDRAQRVPRMETLQAGGRGELLDVPALLREHAAPEVALVLDCLTLWLTQQLMPLEAEEGAGELAVPAPPAGAIADTPVRVEALHQACNASSAVPGHRVAAATADLLEAIQAWPGPLYIVSNEIGLGVIPLGRETRAFVDALGELNQRVAAVCSHVTLMAAGLPLTLKSSERKDLP